MAGDPGAPTLDPNALADQGIAIARGGAAAPGRPLTFHITDGLVPLKPDEQTRGVPAPPVTFTTIDAAINSWFAMGDHFRQKTMDQMFALGLIDGPNRDDQAASVWKDAVSLAWNYAQAGKKVDPFQMFAKMTNLKAGQQGPDGVQTQTNKSYNYMSPEGAKALYVNAFRQAVGRDPTDAEIRVAVNAIAEGYKSNPNTSTSTTTSSTPGASDTTTTSHQGFDAQAYIANQLNSDPEARAHQAAAELYNALPDIIRAPV